MGDILATIAGFGIMAIVVVVQVFIFMIVLGVLAGLFGIPGLAVSFWGAALVRFLFALVFRI